MPRINSFKEENDENNVRIGLRSQNFNRDKPIEKLIPSLVYDSHAAVADFFE